MIPMPFSSCTRAYMPFLRISEQSPERSLKDFGTWHFLFPPLVADLSFFVQTVTKKSDPTMSNKVRRIVFKMFKSQGGSEILVLWQSAWLAKASHLWCSVRQLPAVPDVAWDTCPLWSRVWFSAFLAELSGWALFPSPASPEILPNPSIWKVLPNS